MKRIVLLLLATILLLCILVSCTQMGDTRIEETQTSDFGFGFLGPVHEYDGWIYYTVYPEGIYKVRTNGEDRTLVSEKTPYWFEIYKDRIYYAVYKDGENFDNCIYSCKKDGSDVTFICENYFVAYKVFKFSIVDDWIYYFPKAYELSKVKTDGSQIVELNEKDEIISDFTIEDGWVYYTTEYVNKENGKHYLDLNRVRTDGMLRTKLITENCRNIEIKDDWIYYIHEKEKGVYKVRLDGNGKQKIADYAAGAYRGLFKVIGDWVYYEENSESNGIYKVKTDGSERVKITDDLPCFGVFNVWDNWLVYIEPPMTYPKKEPAVAYLIRLSSTYKTDPVIEQILEEKYPDLEIKKYEEFTPVLNIVQEEEAEVADLPDDSWYSDFDLFSNNFVEYDGWIYYSEFGKFGYDGLYRIMTDGTHKEKICDCMALMFGICGDKLYVLPQGNGVFSVNLDGSDEKKCNFGSGYLSLVTENDSLYMFSYRLSIYSAKPETKDVTMLSTENEKCTDISVSGSWIYYTRHVFDEEWCQYLYKIKTDGTEKTKLTQNGCMAIDYDVEWIYYVDESGKSICKMRMDGSENQKLTDCDSARTCFFKVFGDWVYYENIGDDFGLYKVNTQTGQNMKVLETRMDAYVGMGGNWLINIYKDYSTIPFKTTYQMIRVGNTETTDDIIEKILEEMPEDIEILIVE